MAGRNFLSSNKVVVAKAATVAGTSDAESSILDMSDYRGVVFFTTVTTPAADNYLQVEQHTLNQTSGMAAITGSKLATGTGTNAMSLCGAIEPLERYVRAVVKRGTSTAVSEIWAVLYGGTVGPIDSNTATLVVEQHLQKAEGTA